MGLYDELRCKYPLPIKGANDLLYQTKDTPAQYVDLYEIREDGTLWHENYDTEDQSIRGKWKMEHPREPEPKWDFEAYWGCAVRVNKRWVQIFFTGEIRFYDSLPDRTWREWSAFFMNGRLQHVNKVGEGEESCALSDL